MNLSECAELQISYLLSNPKLLGSALAACDEDGAALLLAECTKRGIDPSAAIAEMGKTIDIFEKMLGPTNVRVSSGRNFRVPIHHVKNA